MGVIDFEKPSVAAEVIDSEKPFDAAVAAAGVETATFVESNRSCQIELRFHLAKDQAKHFVEALVVPFWLSLKSAWPCPTWTKYNFFKTK